MGVPVGKLNASDELANPEYHKKAKVYPWSKGDCFSLHRAQWVSSKGK